MSLPWNGLQSVGWDAEMSDENLRLALISWLEANDRNGCYSDDDCMAEFGWILTLREALTCVTEHIDGEHG